MVTAKTHFAEIRGGCRLLAGLLAAAVLASTGPGCADCGRRKSDRGRGSTGVPRGSGPSSDSFGTGEYRLHKLFLRVPSDSVVAVVATDFDWLRSLGDGLSSGSATCPALRTPKDKSGRKARRLLMMLRNAAAWLVSIGADGSGGAVAYLRRCPKSRSFQLAWTVPVKDGKLYTRNIRRSAGSPSARFLARALLGVVLSRDEIKGEIQPACQPVEPAMVECTIRLRSASGPCPLPSRRGLEMPAALRYTGGAAVRTGVYVDLAGIMSAGTKKALNLMWPGSPPRTLWMTLGRAGDGAGKSPARLVAHLLLPGAGLDLLKDARTPSPSTPLSDVKWLRRDPPLAKALRLRSYVRFSLSLPKLVAWLARLSRSVSQVLKWVRGQGADLRQLVFKSLTGEFLAGSAPAGPVLAAEMQKIGPSRELVRRLDLLAASAVGAAEANSRKRLLGHGARTPLKQPGRVPSEVTFGRILVSGAPASRALWRLHGNPEEPAEVRPGLEKVGLVWGQRARQLVVATHRGAFQRLASATLGQSHAPAGKPARWPIQAKLALDDPGPTLKKNLASRLAAFMADRSRTQRKWAGAAHCVLDRVYLLRLGLRTLKSGLEAYVDIHLVPGGPGSDAGRKVYLDALKDKYSGFMKPYLADLTRAASKHPESLSGKKAGRILEVRKAPAGARMFDLVTGLILPAELRQRYVGYAAEAMVETARIGLRVGSYFQTLAAKGKLPRGRPGWGLTDTPLSPGKRCCAYPDRRCPGSGSHKFRHPTWKRLKFSLPHPHRFQYRIQFTHSRKVLTATIKAFGDLNCNRITSVLTRRIRIRPSGETESTDRPTWNRYLE